MEIGFVTKEISTWLLINLVLPIILPVIFVYLCSFIVVMDKNWYSFFGTLLDKGIYLFVGITLLLNLFQDYNKDDASETFPPKVYFAIAGLLLLTVFLFISSMGIINSTQAVKLEDNATANIYCILFSTLLSIYVKRKIIILNLKKSYNYVG